MAGEMRQESEAVLITTSLRVERGLLARFKTEANKNYRSASAELRRLMTEYVDAADAASEKAAA